MKTLEHPNECPKVSDQTLLSSSIVSIALIYLIFQSKTIHLDNTSRMEGWKAMARKNWDSDTSEQCSG